MKKISKKYDFLVMLVTTVFIFLLMLIFIIFNSDLKQFRNPEDYGACRKDNESSGCNFCRQIEEDAELAWIKCLVCSYVSLAGCK